MELLCEVDGYLTEGIGWIEAPCRKPAEYRYRPVGEPSLKWRYRCGGCAKWSDRTLVHIEPINAGEGS